MPICPEAIGHCYHIQDTEPRGAICCWCSSRLVIRVKVTGDHSTREHLEYVPAPKPVNFHGNMHAERNTTDAPH